MEYPIVYLDNCNIGELEKKYVIDALDSGFISTRGPLVKQVEEFFNSYLNGYTAATYSGTAALHLSLRYSLKKYQIDPIKEKIGIVIPAITFAASVHAALYNNLIPIFCDVDINTFNLDLNSTIEAIKIAKSKGINVRFIMPVHLYGNPCDMENILKISKDYDLIVIEDAAESLGSTYNGIYTGTFGEFGAFSFNANKIITASSGGLIFSKNFNDIEYIKFLTLQARVESKGYYHEDIGYNYRMTNIEAAILLGQIQKLEYFFKLKRKYFEIYYENLKDYTDIIDFQKITPNSKSNYWLITVLFKSNIDISELQLKLKEFNIPTRRIFYPLPLMEMYKKYQLVEDLESFYKNSIVIYSKGLNLPSSTKNSFEAIEYVAQTILKLIK